MRLLVYNIRYGTGGQRPLFPWSGYLRRTGDNLSAMTEFIRSLNPDVVGLLEVDDGSYRSGKRNQAEWIGKELGHYHIYRSKYGESSVAQSFPLINRQGNAFLSRDSIEDERFHYFTQGAKRLVIELELQSVNIFLVHLALGFRVRHHQLRDLYELVKNSTKPVIVAGDFNALWGDREIDLFMAATGLVSANQEGTASFPSWAPKRQLDFVLHSPDIHSQRFTMPRVNYSDHLPLVWDFAVNGNGTTEPHESDSISAHPFQPCQT